MLKSIYIYNDYRNYIKERVKTADPTWGVWTRLAKSCQCQATYLSQAMTGKVHLTQEQILGVAHFFELTEKETDYLFLMLDYAKSGSKILKDRFLKKMDAMKAESEDITKRLNEPQLTVGEKDSTYYSAWYWSAIHILISIPNYQTTNAIAQRLMLPIDFVEYCLNVLSKFEIIKLTNNKWELGIGGIHLPKTSPLTILHHNNWRQRAILSSSSPSTLGLHFTAIYSMSRSDYQRVKELILEVIEKSRRIVNDSPEEMLVSMLCDFFEV